jgi:flagellar biosynthetic protein FliR
VGFPVKIFLTLALGGIVFTALPRVVAALTDQAVNTVMGVR